MSSSEKDYVIVPIDLFKNSKPVDIRVYCELDLLFGSNKGIDYIPHDAEFAAICDLSVEALKESLIRLNELGWLELIGDDESQFIRRIVDFRSISITIQDVIVGGKKKM
ncbi:MAG: hypothetical protein HY033_03015 [Ignavibacteriae bacterium]|nr:hypothetical protein [Ignavibacteria bacterium]MBI3363858.1 hypothetical protein [Ignavibacteriota bacterium]